jgi:hypothetical protein
MKSESTCLIDKVVGQVRQSGGRKSSTGGVEHTASAQVVDSDSFPLLIARAIIVVCEGSIWKAPFSVVSLSMSDKCPSKISSNVKGNRRV